MIPTKPIPFVSAALIAPLQLMPKVEKTQPAQLTAAEQAAFAAAREARKQAAKRERAPRTAAAAEKAPRPEYAVTLTAMTRAGHTLTGTEADIDAARLTAKDWLWHVDGVRAVHIVTSRGQSETITRDELIESAPKLAMPVPVRTAPTAYRRVQFGLITQRAKNERAFFSGC